MKLIPRHAALLMLAAALGWQAPATGAGYYNMPTNLRQCLGVGFGPGYHADLLLGSCMKAGIEAKRVKRIPAPMRPTVSHGFGAPSVWSGGYQGGYQGGYDSMSSGSPAYAPSHDQGMMYGGTPEYGPQPTLAAPMTVVAPSNAAPSNAEVVPAPMLDQ